MRQVWRFVKILRKQMEKRRYFKEVCRLFSVSNNTQSAHKSNSSCCLFFLFARISTQETVRRICLYRRSVGFRIWFGTWFAAACSHRPSVYVCTMADGNRLEMNDQTSLYTRFVGAMDAHSYVFGVYNTKPSASHSGRSLVCVILCTLHTLNGKTGKMSTVCALWIGEKAAAASS